MAKSGTEMACRTISLANGGHVVAEDRLQGHRVLLRFY